MNEQNKWLAFFLGALYPGLGQAYLGRVKEATLFLSTLNILIGILVSLYSYHVIDFNITQYGAIALQVLFQIGLAERAYSLTKNSPNTSHKKSIMKPIITYAIAAILIDCGTMLLIRNTLLYPIYISETNNAMPMSVPPNTCAMAKIPAKANIKEGNIVVYTPSELPIHLIGTVLRIEGDKYFIQNETQVDPFDSRTLGLISKNEIEGVIYDVITPSSFITIVNNLCLGKFDKLELEKLTRKAEIVNWTEYEPDPQGDNTAQQVIDYADNIIIGALSYIQDKYRTSVITPLFYKEGAQWLELSAHRLQPPTRKLAGIKWDVILNGQVIGTVEAGKESLFTRKHERIDLISFENKNHKDFALVLRGSAKDPDLWKPEVPQADELKKMKDMFLKFIDKDIKDGAILLCLDKDSPEQEAQKVSDNCDIYDKVQLTHAYQNRHGTFIGRFLARVAMNNQWTGSVADEDVHNAIWVTYENSLKTSFRSLFNDGGLSSDMSGGDWDADFMGAADFDSTGESKLLFERSGYNMYGYDLLDSKLNNLGTVRISFH